MLPLSLPGQQELFGFVVAGVSVRRALDADYRNFYELLGAAVNTAVGNVIAYEQEQRRAEELAKIDRAKTAFFSNVSHEFRTPLTLILGPLDDALADAADSMSAAQRKRIEVTHRNALRLLKLVNSLLDFSRIEAGRVQASYVPVDLAHLYGERPVGDHRPGQQGQAEVAVRYLTVHNKWAIHSQYYDNPYMLTLGRGGQTVWMSPADAEKIGVRDNEWIEAKNRNGTVTARAVVSHRIPEGTVFMHHAQDRQINTPLNEGSGKRGGTHNSLTRILIKPSHLAGGYAQFSYAFNYYGPTGNNRDEVTVIRRRSQEVQF